MCGPSLEALLVQGGPEVDRLVRSVVELVVAFKEVVVQRTFPLAAGVKFLLGPVELCPERADGGADGVFPPESVAQRRVVAIGLRGLGHDDGAELVDLLLGSDQERLDLG